MMNKYVGFNLLSWRIFLGPMLNCFEIAEVHPVTVFVGICSTLKPCMCEFIAGVVYPWIHPLISSMGILWAVGIQEKCSYFERVSYVLRIGFNLCSLPVCFSSPYFLLHWTCSCLLAYFLFLLHSPREWLAGINKYHSNCVTVNSYNTLFIY